MSNVESVELPFVVVSHITLKHVTCIPVAIVGFRETIYAADEGSVVSVCVEVPAGGCDINFPFDIRFTTIDGTAGN